MGSERRRSPECATTGETRRHRTFSSPKAPEWVHLVVVNESRKHLPAVRSRRERGRSPSILRACIFCIKAALRVKAFDLMAGGVETL
jgi:hypothetical protein